MSLQVADRLDLIRLFLRIAETGQISEAAHALGLSQPTASRSLKRLEALVGTELVARSPQGISLTQAGRDFLAPARRLIDSWHEAVDLARADQTSFSGAIRVGVPTAIGQSFLVAVAAGFMRTHPNVTLEWHLSDGPLNAAAGDYDLWIRVGDVDRDDLIVRHIYRVERALMASASSPAAEHPRDLEASPAVRLAPYVPAAVELTSAAGETHLLRQSVVFTTDNLYAAREAVLERVGFAVLPLWCVQELTARGLLRRLCGAWRAPPILVSIAYAPERRRSPRVAALAAFICAELRDDDGRGIAFIRDTGATDSVTTLPGAQRS